MPLIVHSLNVGRGDCTIIQFPSGRVGVVDIDNLKVLDPDTVQEMLQEYHKAVGFIVRKTRGMNQMELDKRYLLKEFAALTDPLAYYDTHVGARTDMFRFIMTHPDMDHMTGLCRIHEQDDRKSIVNFRHTGNHEFNLSDTNSQEWEDSPYDKRDWETYKKLIRSNVNPKSLQLHQGDSAAYWNEDGIEVLAPTRALEDLAVAQEESNILSMVPRIRYRGRTILLGGDATADETWPAILDQVDKVDVLKASHHGRKSGYFMPAVRMMAPWLTITSVPNAAHDATHNYRRYSNYTVSLRESGDIRITINDDGLLIYSPNVSESLKERIE